MTYHIHILPRIHLQICFHSDVPCDPNKRDFLSVDSKKEQEKLTYWIKEQVACNFPDVNASAPAIEETCIYSVRKLLFILRLSEIACVVKFVK